MLPELKTRMTKCLELFQKELSGLRAGRASPSLLENIKVSVYGSHMPISQLATISVPEPRQITVSVWDKESVKPTEKAIVEANLGLNPMAEGQVIRIALPELTQERRQELVKVAGKYAEGARVSVRSVRKDGIEQVKKQQKAGDVSEDDMHRLIDQIQELTDDFIKEVDTISTTKEKEILQG